MRIKKQKSHSESRLSQLKLDLVNTRQDSFASKYVGIADYAYDGETDEGSGGSDYEVSGSGSGGSDYDGFSLSNSKASSMFRSARVGNSLPGKATALYPRCS